MKLTLIILDAIANAIYRVRRWFNRNVPVGYEDADGFHEGEPR
jgi:hypothetical protein